MLDELQVKNYALIDELSIDFSQGLNILTGETGAGKSILLGALGLILGEKGDTSAIRTGREEAVITGTFELSDTPEAVSWLAERDIEPEDGARVFIRRILKQTGRGSIHISGTPVSRKELKELGNMLVDVHGQHDHQTLLRIQTHREYLDKFGGHDHLVDKLTGIFNELSLKKKELQELVDSEKRRLQEADLLDFAVSEINEANLDPKEEEELEREISMLSQYETLFSTIEKTYQLFNSGKGLLSSCSEAMNNLESSAQIDDTLTEQAQRISGCYYELEDISESIRHYRDTLNYSPERLEQANTRLQLIHRLEKKYGNTIQDVLQYCHQAEEKLEQTHNIEEDKERLKQEIKALEKELVSKGEELTGSRKRAASKLQTAVESRLQKLGMKNARFVINIQPKKTEAGGRKCGPTGFESIEFLISANAGEPEKPLKQVASGGEISRIMLAMKSVFANSDAVETMIFDEIDAGIGGEVALSVGEHLKGLAEHKQLLCITHLASIAVRADNHITVKKIEETEQTNTEVSQISGEERIREIARMLSGEAGDQASLEHARQLLSTYGS
ncbi:MAG: DNA repair protein RecN [Spirochaetia bacterium]